MYKFERVKRKKYVKQVFPRFFVLAEEYQFISKTWRRPITSYLKLECICYTGTLWLNKGEQIWTNKYGSFFVVLPTSELPNQNVN